MSCSFLKTKTEAVLSDEKFLKELESRIGIRFMIFRDKYHGPRCDVFLFGYTDQTRARFFWVETSLSVVGLNNIKFEVWANNISGNFRTNLKSWEERHQTMPKLTDITWWNKLVNNQLFTCVSVSASNVKFERVSTIKATDPRLQIFYGLLAAHIEGHANDLENASNKYWALKGHADVANMVSRRLNGFVSESYFDGFDGFAIPDDV